MTKNTVLVTRLYTGYDGESHFQETFISVPGLSGIGGISQTYEATGVIFRTMPSDYEMDWHRTDKRQYVVIVSGAVEMEVGSGETRVFSQGDIVLSEDKTGRGHKSRSVNGQERTSIFITLE